MSGYTQLTQEERYQIYILKKAEYSQAQIAGLLERDKSTIIRELKRRGCEAIAPNRRTRWLWRGVTRRQPPALMRTSGSRSRH